jgi:antitoxin Phd
VDEREAIWLRDAANFILHMIVKQVQTLQPGSMEIGGRAGHGRRGRTEMYVRLKVRPDCLYSWSDRTEHMATWQVQEAKTRLSEVIERARTEGPQTITRHGAARAVVLSIEDYSALTAHKPDFKTHLLGGPKFDEFSVARDSDTGRDIEI